MSYKLSKYLSYVLRHRPDSIGLTLDGAGWANVDELIEKAQSSGKEMTFELLEKIVSENDKKRFTLSNDKTRIRAAQGHSVQIDIGVGQKEPPVQLYHGTATKNSLSIEQSGLKPGTRRYVHLSTDIVTALKVGTRHGKPMVYVIPAREMFENGHPFWQADNGVWLTKRVSPEFLSVIDHSNANSDPE